MTAANHTPAPALATTFTDRSDATAEEFQAAVDRFGIFAEEERVARAIHDADCLTDCGVVSDHYRRLAVAAIAALAPADETGAGESCGRCKGLGGDPYDGACTDCLGSGLLPIGGSR